MACIGAGLRWTQQCVLMGPWRFAFPSKTGLLCLRPCGKTFGGCWPMPSPACDMMVATGRTLPISNGLMAPQCCGKKPDPSGAPLSIKERKPHTHTPVSWGFIFSLGPSVRPGYLQLSSDGQEGHTSMEAVSFALPLPCVAAQRPGLLTGRGGWARPPCSVVCLTNYATHRKT